MDLYFSNHCGNSKRVLFTLAEPGVDVNRHPLDLRRSEHKSAEYLAVNPLGKVPALVDGSLVLWESNAIVLYLAERFPRGRLVPDSSEGRAELHSGSSIWTARWPRSLGGTSSTRADFSSWVASPILASS